MIQHNTKIASAPTLERLTTLLNEFYYSTTYRIEDNKVYNAKGLVESVEIIYKKGRYTAQFK